MGDGMKTIAAAAFLVLPTAALHAQSMPVSEFLRRADALEKKGALALFSSDLKVLKAEVVNSGKQLRAEHDAALKKGTKPSVCLPEKAKVEREELLAHLRAIPPARRNITVKAAFADLIRRKYPCR